MVSSRRSSVTAALLLVLSFAIAPTARGQDGSGKTTALTAASDSATARRPATRAGSQFAPASPLERYVSVRLDFSGVYDTNIDWEVDPQESVGGVAAFNLRVRTSPRRPLLILSYKGAAKSYTNSSRWDRVEHRFGARLAKRLGAVAVDMVSEVAFRASTEDRELGNQYYLKPRLALDLSDAVRLRLYGAYRLKAVDPPAADEEIRSVGAELRWKMGRSSAEVETRYEKSESDEPSRRYTRWRYIAAYEGYLTRQDIIKIQVQYRPRRYSDVLVDVGGVLEPRDEVRWIPAVTYRHVFPRGHEFRIIYVYQARESNDPDREFTGHRVTLMTRLPLLGF
jgi:hypothetical protein